MYRVPISRTGVAADSPGCRPGRPRGLPGWSSGEPLGAWNTYPSPRGMHRTGLAASGSNPGVADSSRCKRRHRAGAWPDPRL